MSDAMRSIRTISKNVSDVLNAQFMCSPSSGAAHFMYQFQGELINTRLHLDCIAGEAHSVSLRQVISLCPQLSLLQNGYARRNP